MFSRTLRNSILDTRVVSIPLPPIFLLPSRARFLSSTTQHVEPPSPLPADAALSESMQQYELLNASSLPRATHLGRSAPQTPSPPTSPLQLSSSIRELLPLLAIQPAHYISAHIHGKPYLVTTGDTVRLPFRMPGVLPGDVLRLNRATSLGSRDLTLKGAPYLDERLFECRATVLGVESEPMRIKEKTKRRNRKVKTVRSKHKYTILRIAELRVKDLEEVQALAERV